VAATRNGRIGLLATPTTVASGAYAEAVGTIDPYVTLHSVACAELAGIIQAGEQFDAHATETVRSACAPLGEAGADTGILGCTHYPLIRQMLQRIFGRDVTLITSAEEIAREVAETIARRGVGNDPHREGDYRFLCTGDPTAFRDVAGRFLQLPLTEVERVDADALRVAA